MNDGQRRRLAGQIADPGLMLLAEQEHSEQAGRERSRIRESGLATAASGPAASACEASSTVARR